ncbi:MAG: amidohydrolase family protein [Pseudomonadota bacterium]
MRILRQLSCVWPLALALTAIGCAAAEPDADRRTADLIVYGDWVLTMAPDAAPIRDGAVAIRGSDIVAVGARRDIEQRFEAAETLPGERRIVLPGLINGHGHAAMTLLRGVADDIPLQQWLEDYIFPAEVELVDADFVRTGTELACWEMIRGGTTTFVDMYYFPDAVAETVVDCGMRAVVVPSVIDQQAPDAANGEQSLAQAIDFARRWRGRHPRVVPSIGGHAIYTLKPETLSRIRDAAREAGVPVGIHLAESAFEIEMAAATYGKTPVEYFVDTGFFDNPVIGAHVVYPSETDIGLLARHGVGVIHNPTSNMKISSGVSPVAGMLAAGIPVGLGTDGAASNNDLDLWEEIRLAAFLAKVSTMEPRTLPAETVLAMATRIGAEAIGLDERIGQLTPGRAADLIQVSTADLSFVPMYSPVSHLAYVADEHDVVNVVIDGRVVMRDKQVLTIDADRVRREADAISARIRKRLIDN